MSDDPTRTGFSEDYVKELRQEAAGWRTKVRELEDKFSLQEVEVELLRKGVNVNPKWVERKEGQSAGEAVDQFVNDYPDFKSSTTQDSSEDTKPNVPRVMGSGTPNTNKPGPRAGGSFANRTPNEIQKDPKARAALRRHYRELLALASNKPYEGE